MNNNLLCNTVWMISDKIPYSGRKTTVDGSWQFIPFLPIVPSPLLWGILSLLARTQNFGYFTQCRELCRTWGLIVNGSLKCRQIPVEPESSASQKSPRCQGTNTQPCLFKNYLKAPDLVPSCHGGKEPALTIIVQSSSEERKMKDGFLRLSFENCPAIFSLNGAYLPTQKF